MVIPARALSSAYAAAVLMEQVIGDFKILNQAGEGSMGAVFRAVDLMLDREVALKSLRPELARQKETAERFREEARVLARLNHPNIGQVYSFFEHGSDLFMVMEYLNGPTLEEVIRRKGKMPFTEALPAFLQVLDGVDYAHRMGIVHRDLKPANIMFTETGAVKVTDFGVARVLGAARMTRPGTMIGTLQYMPPERVMGRELDARSDQYSLGFVFFEMLSGAPPFSSEVEYELMLAQTEQIPPRIQDRVAGVPREVSDAIFRTMAKNPGDRFDSVAQFSEVLRKYTNESQGVFANSTAGLPDAAVSGPRVAFASRSPRSRLYLFAVIGLALLIAATLAVLAPRPGPATVPLASESGTVAAGEGSRPAGIAGSGTGDSAAAIDQPAAATRQAGAVTGPVSPVPQVKAPDSSESSTPAQNFGTLAGRVVDTDHIAVRGARVTIGSPGGNTSVTTSSDGKFFFARCRPNNYELTIEAPGFRKYARQVKIDAMAEISLPPIRIERMQAASPLPGTEDR